MDFLILIYSNEASGEIITFKFYDSETGTVYDIEEQYDFVSDMILGDVLNPEQLTIIDVVSAQVVCMIVMENVILVQQ